MGYEVVVRMTLKDEIAESFTLEAAQKEDPNIDSMEGVIELDLKEWFQENEYYGEMIETFAVHVTKR